MKAEGVTVKINQKYNSEVSSIASQKLSATMVPETSRGKSQTKYQADSQIKVG